MAKGDMPVVEFEQRRAATAAARNTRVKGDAESEKDKPKPPPADVQLEQEALAAFRFGRDANGDLCLSRDGRYWEPLVAGEKSRRGRGKKRLRQLARAKGIRATRAQIEAVLERLVDYAEDEGRELKLCHRVALVAGAVVYDLGDGRQVLITGDGWGLDTSRAEFSMSPKMAPQVTPERGGTVGDLLDLLGPVLDTPNQIRLWAALVNALIWGPQQLVLVHGPFRSGKTELARMVQALVCPRPSWERAPRPWKDEKDLMARLRTEWVLLFDNVSSIDRDRADMLCGLSTGGGQVFRTYFTDDDSNEWSGYRPVVVTSTSASLFSRFPDLSSRTLAIETQRLAHPDPDVVDRFQERRPRILGALFDCVSAALRHEAAARETIVRRGKVRDPRWHLRPYAAANEDCVPWSPAEVLEALTAGPTYGHPVAALAALAFPDGVRASNAEIHRQLMVAAESDVAAHREAVRELQQYDPDDDPRALGQLLNRVSGAMRDLGWWCQKKRLGPNRDRGWVWNPPREEEQSR